MIKIKPKLLVHVGGTKFYEVVTFVNEDNGKAAIIKRWGPVASRGRGGQQKFESHFDELSAKKASEKIIDSKTAGGYEIVSACPEDGALHTEVVGSISHSISPDEFQRIASKHYGDKSTVMALTESLCIDAVAITTADIYKLGNKKRKPEPQPEPERSADWGSW